MTKLTLKLSILFVFQFVFFFSPLGQTIAYKETIGTYSGTISVASYTGWSNGTTYTHTVTAGTVALNSSVSASNYTNASGGTPVKVSGSSTWIISGINTSSYTNLKLSFGIHKVNFNNSGSGMNIEVSSDGINYTTLTWTALPTGSGTGDTWHYRAGGVDVTGTIPCASNLRIRFRNTSSNSYDFDDIEITGSVVLPVQLTSFTAEIALTTQ